MKANGADLSYYRMRMLEAKAVDNDIAYERCSQQIGIKNWEKLDLEIRSMTSHTENGAYVRIRELLRKSEDELYQKALALAEQRAEEREQPVTVTRADVDQAADAVFRPLVLAD